MTAGPCPIARHPRSYAKGEEVIDPVHFLPLLEQRVGAFEHSRAMRQLRRALPPVFDDLLARLRQDEGLGVREFVRTLRLLEQHPRLALEEAVSTTLKLNTVNRDAIELILRTRNQPAWPPPLDPALLPALAAQIARAGAPDVGIYDGLLSAALAAPAANMEISK